MRWEMLPNNSNRVYRARFARVVIEGTEGDKYGKEIIEKKFHSSGRLAAEGKTKIFSSFNQYQRRSLLRGEIRMLED